MATLDLDGVLNELEVLATVEHALIVEYLSVCCALGHDLEAEEGGPTTDRGRAAVAAASALAQNETFDPDFAVSGAFRGLAVSAMMTLHDSNRLLVQRGLLPPFTPA